MATLATRFSGSRRGIPAGPAVVRGAVAGWVRADRGGSVGSVCRAGRAVAASGAQQPPLTRNLPAAVDHVLAGFAGLSVHPDAPEAVHRLRRTGFRLATCQTVNPASLPSCSSARAFERSSKPCSRWRTLKCGSRPPAPINSLPEPAACSRRGSCWWRFTLGHRRGGAAGPADRLNQPVRNRRTRAISPRRAGWRPPGRPCRRPWRDLLPTSLTAGQAPAVSSGLGRDEAGPAC